MPGKIYDRFRRITSGEGYIPQIDGIRFFLIASVVVFHINGYFVADSPALHFTSHEQGRYFDCFRRSVQLFFVLSGFILCLPFARHYIEHATKMSLKRYYLRRLTRLEIPYIAALTLTAALLLVRHKYAPGDVVRHWLVSLVYLHNIVYRQTSIISVVFYTLEIEVQFYLMAPLFFRLLALPPASRRVILFVTAIVSFQLQAFYRPPFVSIYNCLSYFLIGVLLADLYVSKFAVAAIKKPWAVLPGIICLAMAYLLPLTRANFMGPVALSAMLVFFHIAVNNDIFRKILSYKYIPVIGGMCYSIYMLHYTIISLFGRYTTRIKVTDQYFPNLLLQLLLLGIPVLILTAVFYLYVERPFMSNKWVDMLLNKKATARGNLRS